MVGCLQPAIDSQVLERAMISPPPDFRLESSSCFPFADFYVLEDWRHGHGNSMCFAVSATNGRFRFDSWMVSKITGDLMELN